MSDSYKSPKTRKRMAMLARRARRDRQTNYRADWRAINKREREEAKNRDRD